MNRPERSPESRSWPDPIGPYPPLHDPARSSRRRVRTSAELSGFAGVIRIDPVARVSRAPDEGRQIDPSAVQRFVTLLLGSDEQAVDDFVAELRESGISVESIYLELMGPAARRLGTMWEEDDCDFLDVTLALGRMQRVIRSSTEGFRREGPIRQVVGRAMLSCLPGKDHSLGVLIVAEFMVRAGWSVTFGAPFGPGDGLDPLRHESYDVVGISVSCDFDVTALTGFVRRVREASCNPGVGVLVGGRVINDAPKLVRRVGADATAADARSAVRVAASFLP